ncbi:hypothetical protein CCR75_008955 [Bremia lactucae]|uniref:RxLR effector protein n=1 Tax=Bremia lactucae TaxID=4779 RepID=A0A976FMA7_BRELC|nr:hypothetical protein CCR75_008955 [Bremia lactucae]
MRVHLVFLALFGALATLAVCSSTDDSKDKVSNEFLTSAYTNSARPLRALRVEIDARHGTKNDVNESRSARSVYQSMLYTVAHKMNLSPTKVLSYTHYAPDLSEIEMLRRWFLYVKMYEKVYPKYKFPVKKVIKMMMRRTEPKQLKAILEELSGDARTRQFANLLLDRMDKPKNESFWKWLLKISKLS